MRRRNVLLPAALAALACCAAGCGPRPESWAEPLERPGLPNLHRVSKTLYRSAQPRAAGFAEMKKLGVRTVINLRTSDSDREHIAGTKMAYERIPFRSRPMKDEHVIRFLKLVTDAKRQPVLVHCRAGADRTGVMCAVYRVVVQGWSKPDAIREMTRGGYHFHGLLFRNLVHYIRELDVEEIRRRAGLGRKRGQRARKAA